MFVPPRALPSPPRSTSNEEAAEEDLLSDLFHHRATPPPSPSTESSEEDEDGDEYGDEENDRQEASQKRSEIPPQRLPCTESNDGDEDNGDDSNNTKKSSERSSSEDEDGEHDREQVIKKSCEAPPPRASSTQSDQENKREGNDSKNATQKNNESSSSGDEDGVDGRKETSQKNSEALPPPSPSMESSDVDEDEENVDKDEENDRKITSKRRSSETLPPPSPSTGSSDEDEKAEDSVNAFQKNTEIPPPSSPSSKSNDERDGSKNASHKSRESPLAGDGYDGNYRMKASQKRSEVPPPPSPSVESRGGDEEEDSSKYASRESSQSLLAGKESEDDRKPESQKCSEFLPPPSPSTESNDEDDNNNTGASQKRSEKPSAGDEGRGDISISDTYKRSLVQPPTSPYAESSDEDTGDDSSKERPSIQPDRRDVGTSGVWDDRVEGAEVNGSLLTELLAADPPGVKAVTEPTSTIVNATAVSPPSAALVTTPPDRAERSPQPRQQTATEDQPRLSLTCNQQGRSSSPVASDLEPAAPLPPPSPSPSRVPGQGHQRPPRSRKQGQSCHTIATSESNTRLSSPTHERTQRQGAPSSSSRRGRSNGRGDHPLETSTAPADADRQSLAKRVAQTKPKRARSNLVVRSVREDHAPVRDDSTRGGEVASSFDDTTPPARTGSRRDQGRNTSQSITLFSLSALRNSTPPLSPSSPSTLDLAADGETAVSTRTTSMSPAERSKGRSNIAVRRILPGSLVTPPSVPARTMANESKGSTDSTSKRDAPDASTSTVCSPRPAAASQLLDAAAGLASLSSFSTRSVASVPTRPSDGDSQGEAAESLLILNDSRTKADSAPRRRSSMTIGATSEGEEVVEESGELFDRQQSPRKSAQPSQRRRRAPVQGSGLEEGKAKKKRPRKQTSAPRRSVSPPPLPARKMASESEGSTGTSPTHGDPEASTATVHSRHLATASRLLDVGSGAASSSSSSTRSGAAANGVGSVLRTQDQSGESIVVGSDRCSGDGDTGGEVAESSLLSNESRTTSESASGSVTVSSRGSPSKSATASLPTPRRVNYRRQSSATTGATPGGTAANEGPGDSSERQGPPSKSGQPSKRRRRAPVQGSGLEEEKAKKKRPRKQAPAPGSSVSPPPLPAKKVNSGGRSRVTTGAESGGTAANQEFGNSSEGQGEPSKSVQPPSQRRRRTPAQGSGLEGGRAKNKRSRKSAPTSAPASGTSNTSENVAGNDPHRMDDGTTGPNEGILSTTYEEDLALVRERQADYEGLLAIEAMLRREIVALQAEEDELRGFEGSPAVHQELAPPPPTPMLTLVPSSCEAQINMQKRGACAKPDASARKPARKGRPSTEGARSSHGNVAGPEESSGVIGIGTHVSVPVSRDSSSNPIGSPAPPPRGLPSGTSREGTPDLSGNHDNLDVTETASGSRNTDDIDGIAQSKSGTCEARPSSRNDDGPPETSRALGHVAVPTPPMGPSNDALGSLLPPLPGTPVGTLCGLSVSSKEGDIFDMEGLLLGDDDSDDDKDGNALIMGGKQDSGSAALPLDRASDYFRAPERGREAVAVGGQGRGGGRTYTAVGARGRGRGGRVSGIRPAPAKTGPNRPKYLDLNATYKRYDSRRGRGRRGGRGGNI